MKSTAVLVLVLLSLWLPGCSSTPKAKPRAPLALRGAVTPPALQATAQGTEAYQAGRYEDAKNSFEQALGAAPTVAEAHYNLGLALFALGQGDQARDHFIQAANLAPGDKVIWDSPALRPFNSPDPNIQKAVKEQNYSNQRPQFGGGGPRR